MPGGTPQGHEAVRKASHQRGVTLWGRGTKNRWVACAPLRKQFQIRRDAGQRMWGRGRQWGGQGGCGVQTLGGKGQGREQKLEERTRGGKGVWVSF